MKSTSETGEGEIKFLRWSARAMGLLVGAFMLFISFDVLELCGLIPVASSVAMLLSVLIAWRREKVGGVMVILATLLPRASFSTGSTVW